LLNRYKMLIRLMFTLDLFKKCMNTNYLITPPSENIKERGETIRLEQKTI